jgi:hypothetical protein
MSEVETSMKGSTALTVGKNKIVLKGKTECGLFYTVLYNGNLRCMYERRDWEARLAVAGKGTSYGFILRHLHTGIETPIMWFE